MMNEKEYSKIIARNLRRLMYEKQKTQAEVSRELGISKATLSSWMNGTRQPKARRMVQCVNAPKCVPSCTR